MPRFANGEIAILIKADKCPAAVGNRVEVLRKARYIPACYHVHIPGFPSPSASGGQECDWWTIPESYLRKIDNGRDISSWDTGIFKPKDLQAKETEEEEKIPCLTK